MLTSTLTSITNVIFDLLQYAFYILSVVLIPFLFMFIVFFLFHVIKGDRLKKRSVPRSSFHYAAVPNYVKLLLWDLPKRYTADLFTRDPDDFDVYGVHVFCGEQGSGKTSAAMHFIKSIIERNPAAKLSSNIVLNFQDGIIHDWTDILNTNNGSHGQIIFLDEIQNWFSSNESKNFPPDMLTEITQQRKQRKIIVGTSQVFTRVSKPIREQITLLYKPMTIFGCFTIVRVYKVKLTDDGTVDKMTMRKCYAFVHDNELRNCYDTYEKVERLTLKGFQPRSEQLSREDGRQN